MPTTTSTVTQQLSQRECGWFIALFPYIRPVTLRGVRAALVYDRYTAKMSREHNDANVLCLGSRTATKKKSLALILLWLTTKFSGDARHVRRLRKISKYENK